MNGKFIISLDFELLWGVRDHADRDSYGRNVLGAREAVPRLLALFEKHGIRATWATVGFLFCEDKDELLACLPERRPSYRNKRLSNYGYIDEVGQNESKDPYYFAPSLVDAIRETAGQEIATHTLSHFYCLEDGVTLESFAADIKTARVVAERRGIDLRSIVFPRNQYAQAHLDICLAQGLTNYRGNQTAWAYRATKGVEQTKLRRATRLADAYTGILGPQDFVMSGEAPINVPASQFLRPCAGRLAPFHGRHIATIKRGMTHAARNATGYHLWWHPHNFGRDLEANMTGLADLLIHFAALRDAHGMVSSTMAEI